ncbi:MAG: SurA N-terminal domain-containing protein [Syntrophobacterales bacterium]|jgi:peptidyl-prolyl cis-trans isomerase SurA|nr:SurA N-terminal domain-containing protein [Syntrophobacterales bacterium]
MTNVKRCWVFVLGAVLFQIWLTGPGIAEVVDRIVAEVNNEIITMSELQMMVKTIAAQSGMKPKDAESRAMQLQMLNSLIDRKLAKAEAKRRGITVSPKELDEALSRFKQRSNIPNDEALAKALSQEGISFKEFKQQIADQMTQDRLLTVTVGSKTTVSDAEVRRLYDQRFKQGGSQIHLVSVKMPFPPGASQEQKSEMNRKADALIKMTKQGESMTAAASKLGLNATDLGFVSQGDLDPRLAEYLEKLKPKEVAPIETPEGYQLIQLAGRRSGEARPFEEVAPEIRRMLMEQEMQKHFGEWVKTLREKAHIKIML